MTTDLSPLPEQEAVEPSASELPGILLVLGVLATLAVIALLAI